MTTGYTMPVENGTFTTLEDYALSTARAFVFQCRESSDPFVPERVDPDTAHWNDEIAGLHREIAHLKASTTDEVAQMAADEHEAAWARVRELERETTTKSARLTAMREKVQAWQPPETHASLRAFMLEQLAHEPMPALAVPPPGDVEVWREQRLGFLESELGYCIEQRTGIIQRADQTNRWLADLRESLKGGDDAVDR